MMKAFVVRREEVWITSDGTRDESGENKVVFSDYSLAVDYARALTLCEKCEKFLDEGADKGDVNVEYPSDWLISRHSPYWKISQKDHCEYIFIDERNLI